jgi:ATP-dependent DNA helicase RecQ
MTHSLDTTAAARGVQRPRHDLRELREKVEQVWGYSELRLLQAEAMQAALDGRDALVVLATGGGKSLCYQAPALVREGLTAVVSPLISLMQDQLSGLHENGVGAAMLSSAQDGAEKRAVFEQLAARRLQLLFVAPERLVMPGFFDELVAHGLSGLVIDEAHCISHWGHDFRPEYRKIGALRRAHPQLPVQAFTATATPEVRADIVEQLGLVDALELVGNFDRPNLTYRFVPRGELVEQVLAVIRRHATQAGIVYCLRRADVDSLAPQLARAGVRAVPYHAGLDAQTRRRNQQFFLAEEIDVVVATVAFGMGIDRPDVRFVVHANMPKGIEHYVQESGRAGRDGLPSECVMLYTGADYYGCKALIENSVAGAVAGGVADADQDLGASLARLSRMFAFASGAICRHKFLVEHFGGTWQRPEELAPDIAGCGACDVCLAELATVEGAQVVAQKILSCVVRCGQRYGASHVADVLRGAATERIESAGHARLSTFGLLAAHSQREIRHWIEQLVGQGHLRVAGGRYPTLYLSPSGVEVMRGERPIVLFASPDKPGARSGSKSRSRSRAGAVDEATAARVDASLFEKLRALRRSLARERGVPPYVIFNDRSLIELAALQPRDAEQLRRVKGVGEVKARELGPAFLAAIRAHVEAGSSGG